ncbi:MAG: cache domain-containing protein, partial [Lachnospiraceae bacterium]|nr:cache domain-containing protein [Lachnospiraceae bacterium]
MDEEKTLNEGLEYEAGDMGNEYNDLGNNEVFEEELPTYYDTDNPVDYDSDDYASEALEGSDLETDRASSSYDSFADSESEVFDGETDYSEENTSTIIEDDGLIKSSYPMRNDRFRIFNFRIKLLMLCLIPMIIVSIVVIYVSSNALTTKIEKQIEESLVITTSSLDVFYNTLYKGDYTMDPGGRLYKGEEKISGDNSVVDALKESTGYESSIIYGTMRLLTTLKKDAGEGRRINGTDVDAKIAEKVESSGKAVFMNDVEIEEITYYTYYAPLVNSDGTVCGMVAAATPVDEVQKMIAKERNRVIIISVIILLASLILVSFIAAGMSKTMRKTK